jgi:hypothetical protein
VGSVAWRWLEVPPADWDALLEQDPNASPAHRPALWRALADSATGLSPEFIAVERDGALLGGCGVVVERRGGLFWIHALPHLLPGAPLARAGEHHAVDRAVAEALAIRLHALRAVGGEWVMYRPMGPTPEAAVLDWLSGQTRMLETAWIELDGGRERAWRSLEGDLRQQIRRAHRIGLEFREEPEALEEAYALYAAQARAWRGHRLRPLALVRRLLAGAGDDPAVGRLFTVRDRGGLLAAVLALTRAREVMAWWAGVHPAGRRRHAFPLLLWSVAEWAASAGAVRLNLGGSAGSESLAAFKRSFGARSFRYPVRWLDAAHAGFFGRWVARLQEARRRDRARGEEP